jgi:cyd operon protein YbgT
MVKATSALFLAPSPSTLKTHDSTSQRSPTMWYFTWILGVLLAVAFGIINVMWYESEQCLGEPDDDKLDA